MNGTSCNFDFERVKLFRYDAIAFQIFSLKLQSLAMSKMLLKCLQKHKID